MKAKGLIILIIAVLVLAAMVLFSRQAVYISIIAVGLAVALQKYVASFFGYILIVFSHIFSVGNRIRIGNIKGDVRRIGLFHFMLEEVGEDEKMGGELTGRILHIPNLIVLDQPLLNYSKDYSVGGNLIESELIFDEIRIPRSLQSDVPQAARILEEILAEEDKPYLEEARHAFGQDYPDFLKEAERGPRILVHVEPQHVWLKGKFVTPFRIRNDLKTRIYLRFMERAGKEAAIHLG